MRSSKNNRKKVLPRSVKMLILKQEVLKLFTDVPLTLLELSRLTGFNITCVTILKYAKELELEGLAYTAYKKGKKHKNWYVSLKPINQ